MGFKVGPMPKKIKVKTPKTKPKKKPLTDAQRRARRQKTADILGALGGAIGGGETSEGDTYNPVAERKQEKVELNPFDEQNTEHAAGHK